MSNFNSDVPVLLNNAADNADAQEDSGFAEILSSFERQHSEGASGENMSGTIVSVSPENILVDIGRKIEGVLPIARWRETEKASPLWARPLPLQLVLVTKKVITSCPRLRSIAQGLDCSAGCF